MGLTIKQELDVIAVSKPIQSLQGTFHRFRRLKFPAINDDGHDPPSLFVIVAPISVVPNALSHMG